jgi:trehalose 6-phosphate phosphatase
MPPLPRPKPEWALFLDVDGTILDIAPTPEGVGVPNGLIPSLASLHQFLDGALALVSGRAIADIDRLFAPLVLPAAGQHGAELRLAPGAVIERRKRPPTLDRFRPLLDRFAEQHKGILIEDKGSSIAVHYRNAELFAEAAYQAAQGILDGAEDDLHLLPARMAFEIKPRDVSKAFAIERLMRAPMFSGRVPIFIGDDITDEAGFAAVERFGGYGIHVGDGDSGAKFRFAAPKDVREWLAAMGDEIFEAR